MSEAAAPEPEAPEAAAAAAAVEPEPAAPEQPAGEQAAQPPELGEAVQEMRAEMAALASRLPEPEPEPGLIDSLIAQAGEPEQPQGGQQAQPQAGEPDPDQLLMQELGHLIREGIQAEVTPYFQQQEHNRRSEALLAMQETYPRLKEPDVINAVADQTRRIAERYGIPGLQTDPEVVLQAYRAFEAEAAASGEGTAEAVSRTNGAVLESGAGPSAPTPEVDPIQAEYDRALTPTVGGDVFTR